MSANVLHLLWTSVHFLYVSFGIFFKQLSNVVLRKQKPSLSPHAFHGKVALITGANSGIGLEAARLLAEEGLRVLIACRSEERGLQAVEDVKATTGNPNVEFIKCDLNSLKSVQECAKEVERREIPLSVLINNAGIMFVPYSNTEDGFESHFGVNHLGHFHLTQLLLPTLRRNAPSRVVVTSSDAHQGVDMDWDSDCQPTKEKYSPMKAYATSKLANILFVRELQRREHSNGITASAVHPGIVQTNIFRTLHWTIELLVKKCGGLFFKTAREGGFTLAHAGISPEVEGRGGQYWVDSYVASPSKQSLKDGAPPRLWEISEKLIRNTIKK